MILIVWCPEDKTVVLTSDTQAFCEVCNEVMVNIGWMKVDA